MKSSFLLIVLLHIAVLAHAVVDYPKNYSWKDIASTESEVDKIDKVIEKARFQYYIEKDWPTADSIIKVPLGWNIKTIDAQEKLFLALGKYGVVKSNFNEIDAWFRLHNPNADAVLSWWYLWLNIIKHEQNYEAGHGLELVDELIEGSKNFSDSTYKGLAYLEKARLHNIEKEKIEALRAYLTAKDILERNQSYYLLVELQRELMYFYISVGRAEEALSISLQGADILSIWADADSLDFHEAVFNQLYSRYSHPDRFPGMEIFEENINWTNEKGIDLLHSYYTGVYRTYLIKNGYFKRLKDFYLEKYPIEFEQLKTEQYPLYLRLKAYFLELENEIDTANWYWQQALVEYAKEDEPVLRANMHYRYAEFLLRHNQADLAKNHLHRAAILDQLGNDLNIQCNAMQKLEEIYSAQKIYDSAFIYQAKHYQLKDSISRMNEQDKLVLAEVIFQNNVLQREQEEQMRIQNLKISGFAVGFGIFLMLSGITFYQYRQTKKEKHRSDELLLNILPEATAEELKENGKTTAKRYEQVTVLFGDFVDFTRWAERLSPAELVQEIDQYFIAFDNIITKYGLEKIKTIGDAYMAVGGLPEGNKATAIEVANAAMEMQAMVNSLNESYVREKPVEMRIGIHTGVVVAGVVGNKKFQFDIWGDAVNTAARMEQNGIPGRINISEATYHEIKNQFDCTHRGKIYAKNKGEMDMYLIN